MKTIMRSASAMLDGSSSFSRNSGQSRMGIDSGYRSFCFISPNDDSFISFCSRKFSNKLGFMSLSIHGMYESRKL